MSPVTTKYMPLPCLLLVQRLQQQQLPHRHLLQRCHLRRRRGLHQFRGLVLLQRRARSFAYEKETHCSVRLIQSAPTTRSVFLRCRNLLNDCNRNAARFLAPRCASASIPQRSLTFAERVAYQRAIEEVYWRHRIWPKERPDPKPSLDAVMSQAQLERKVHDYLRKSQALQDYWQQPITSEQLQAEINRMAKHTKQPEVLRELFQALGNDPLVVAECLARPILAERLFTSALAYHDVSWAVSQRSRSRKADRPFSGYTLPTIVTALKPEGTCFDAWGATSTANAPYARAYHTAVWTGSEMIVWGGYDGARSYLNTGGKYNPTTDSWTPTSHHQRAIWRDCHTAVWTGTEMIVWGGGNTSFLNTGGRYNPSTDTWAATSIINAPDGRTAHTAVWTGSEMIVWGGESGSGDQNTGGRYNPGSDSWTATSITNAPIGRASHTAVWTGTEMIVWGGDYFDGAYHYLQSGGRYNPSTDSWAATSTTNAPAGRNDHTAVWTGNEMIVWGGDDGSSFVNTGGRYNPLHGQLDSHEHH